MRFTRPLVPPLLILSLVFAAASAQAQEKQASAAYRQYLFLAKGPDLATLQLVKNCVQYATCAVTTEILEGKPGEYRLFYRAFLTDRDWENLTLQCPSSQLPASLEVWDETEEQGRKVDVKWNDDEATRARYYAARPNVALRVLTDPDYQSLKERVTRQIASKDYQGAIDSTIAGLGLQALGSPVTYDKSLGNYCVTDKQTLAIRIGSGFMENPGKTRDDPATPNPLSLFHGLRHELDHVGQILHARQCELQNGAPGTFNFSANRERSEYLDDLRNVGALCGRDSKCMDALSRGILSQFQRYIDHADLRPNK